MARQQTGGFGFQPIRIGQQPQVGSVGPAGVPTNPLQNIAAGFDKLVPGLSSYIYEGRKEEVQNIRKAVVNLVENNPELKAELEGAKTAAERSAILEKYRKSANLSPLDDPAGIRFLGVMNAKANFDTYTELLNKAELEGEYKSRIEYDDNGNQVIVPGKTFAEIAQETKAQMGYMDKDGEAEFNRLMTINRGEFSKRWEEARIKQDRQVSKEATFRGVYTDASRGDRVAVQQSFDQIYATFGQEAPEVVLDSIRFSANKALLEDGMEAVDTLLFDTLPEVNMGLAPLSKNGKFLEVRRELSESLRERSLQMENTAYQKKQQAFRNSKDTLIDFGYGLEGSHFDLWQGLQEKASELIKANPDAASTINQAVVDAYETVNNHKIANADVLFPGLTDLLRSIEESDSTIDVRTKQTSSFSIDMPSSARAKVSQAVEAKLRQLEFYEKSPVASTAISNLRTLKQDIPKDIPYANQVELRKILMDAEKFAISFAEWSTNGERVDQYTKSLQEFELEFARKRSESVEKLATTKKTWLEQINNGGATEALGIDLIKDYGSEMVASNYLAPLAERKNKIDNVINRTEVRFMVDSVAYSVAQQKQEETGTSIPVEELRASIRSDINKALTTEALYNGVSTDALADKALATVQELASSRYGSTQAQLDILKDSNDYLEYRKVRDTLAEVNGRVADKSSPGSFADTASMEAELKGLYGDVSGINYDPKKDFLPSLLHYGKFGVPEGVGYVRNVAVNKLYKGVCGFYTFCIPIYLKEEGRLKDKKLGSLAILPGGITVSEYENGYVDFLTEEGNVQIPFRKEDVDPLRIHLFVGLDEIATNKAIDKMIRDEHPLIKGFDEETLRTFRNVQTYMSAQRFVPKRY